MANAGGSFRKHMQQEAAQFLVYGDTRFTAGILPGSSSRNWGLMRGARKGRICLKGLVGPEGFEPPTKGL